MIPLRLRKEARECWLYDEGQKKANVMKADARGLSSVSLAADSSLCGGSLLRLRTRDFASAEARRWLSYRPRHPFGPHL